MSNKRFYKTVTEKREVTGVIRDLCLFAHCLVEHQAKTGVEVREFTDDTLINLADEFWDREHGE